MPSLAEIQAAFVDGLKRPEAQTPKVVAEKDGVRPKRRFDVYRNNVAVGMIEALRASYPAIDKLVGADFFNAAARVYLERHPARSPLLFRYGDGFGDFLENFPPAGSVPYLGDVARLEWARLQAYHAADREPLSIEALAAFAEHEVGKLRFALQPSLALIESRWPIVSLWAASTGVGEEAAVDMKRPERALIVRPALTVETRSLPAGGFAFLKSLEGGAILEGAAARAIEADCGFDLALHLQELFALGAVVGVDQSA